MKISFRALRILRRKRQTLSSGDTPPAPRWLTGWVLPLLCVAAAAVATFFLFNNVLLTRLPRAMLGKWVVTEGEMKGAVLEFFRDGTMFAAVDMKGKAGLIKARVAVDGDTLQSTTVNPLTRREETDIQTIVTLTDTHFAIEDRKGNVIRMERLRPADW